MQPTASNNLKRACRKHATHLLSGDGVRRASLAVRWQERKVTDQSILNHVFPLRSASQPNFTVIPDFGQLNAVPSSQLKNTSKILHFINEPKPWLSNALEAARMHHYSARWISKYRETCKSSIEWGEATQAWSQFATRFEHVSEHVERSRRSNHTAGFR